MPGALYVEYVSPKQPPEYYDLATDPDARSNVFSSLSSGPAGPAGGPARSAAQLQRRRRLPARRPAVIGLSVHVIEVLGLQG